MFRCSFRGKEWLPRDTCIVGELGWEQGFPRAIFFFGDKM